MTTDNITSSRAALTNEDVRAAGGIVHRDGNVFFTSIAQLNAALTEARAAMDAQGEAVDCAYFSSQGACCESGEPCKADRHNDALYIHPQATEPAKSSNPSGEHSEPSLLGSEPAAEDLARAFEQGIGTNNGDVDSAGAYAAEFANKPIGKPKLVPLGDSTIHLVDGKWVHEITRYDSHGKLVSTEINDLTQAETDATMSVRGLSNQQDNRFYREKSTEQTPSTELPGMWDTSDFTGGATDMPAPSTAGERVSPEVLRLRQQLDGTTANLESYRERFNIAMKNCDRYTDRIAELEAAQSTQRERLEAAISLHDAWLYFTGAEPSLSRLGQAIDNAAALLQSTAMPATTKEARWVRIGEDGEGQENYCEECGAEPGSSCTDVDGREWGRRVHAIRQEEPTALPVGELTDGDIEKIFSETRYDEGVGTHATLVSAILAAARSQPVREPMTVKLCSYPESNGKRNWTAMFIRTKPWGGLIGNAGGITIDRGECWNRVAYEAERARVLIGERINEPDILQYGKDVATPEEWTGSDPEAAHGITKKGGE